VDKDIDINHQAGFQGFSALYRAAIESTLEILKIIISKGGDVNIITKNMKRTPLAKACQIGKLEVARVLLQHPDILVN